MIKEKYTRVFQKELNKAYNYGFFFGSAWGLILLGFYLYATYES